MAKYASLSGESFGVDDTRLKWSFLKGGEGERKKERGGKGGRGRGKERGREGGRGERVLSLSFKGKVTDPEEEWTSKLDHS